MNYVYEPSSPLFGHIVEIDHPLAAIVAGAAPGAATHQECADPHLDRIGWYCGNSSGRTLPVGGRAANAFGLYDMSGNVWEWTWDAYRADYELGPAEDPSGDPSGVNRTARGGSFFDRARDCWSALRQDLPPTERSRLTGFRIVSSPDPDKDDVDTFYDNCPMNYNPDQEARYPRCRADGQEIEERNEGYRVEVEGQYTWHPLRNNLITAAASAGSRARHDPQGGCPIAAYIHSTGAL